MEKRSKAVNPAKKLHFILLFSIALIKKRKVKMMSVNAAMYRGLRKIVKKILNSGTQRSIGWAEKSGLLVKNGMAKKPKPDENTATSIAKRREEGCLKTRLKNASRPVMSSGIRTIRA